jgi:hypothetical protein
LEESWASTSPGIEDAFRRNATVPIDDLAELVDGAVSVAPPAGDLHVGLIHVPAVPDGVPAGPGGLGE